MSILTRPPTNPVAPTPEDTAFARESARLLTPSLARADGTVRLRMDDPNAPQEGVAVPTVAFELLLRILNEMGQGKAVSVINYAQEVTTGEMARLLNVSVPFAIKMLDEGKLPSRMVGTHRRARLADVLAYRDEQYAARKAVLERLSDQDQELGLT